MHIYTIGYEGLSTDQFANLLTRYKINILVDVRELPLSRKKGFSKKALDNLTESVGIGYKHIRELGAPKPVRDRLKNGGSWTVYKRDFLKHLEKNEESLIKLADLAHHVNCALLCFEADFNFCHRTIVANNVAERGSRSVRHITKLGLRTNPAELQHAAVA